jgi:hypothetical protein
MQDIAPNRGSPSWSLQEWIRWFQTDRWAQALGLVFLMSVGLIALGGYGVGQKVNAKTITLAKATQSEISKNGFSTF